MSSRCARGSRLGPNSNLRPFASWLRWAKPCWCRPIGRAASSSASGAVERRRDHRQVDRQRELGEQVQQRAQAVGAPARVVVAEEEEDGSGSGVERGPDGLQHHHF
jgi:hypothetical protein